MPDQVGGGGDPPIIITGGSVTIEFDASVLLPDGVGKLRNAQKVIKRVEITGAGIQNYDQNATGSDITIKITYSNP